MWSVVITLLKTRLGSSVATAVAAALLAGTFVHVRENRAHAADVKHLETSHALEMANINAAASQQQLENDARFQEAQNAAKYREITLRNDAAGARAAADGLRSTTARLRSEISELSATTAALRTAAAYTVLDSCTDRYQQLAETADRHVNDIKTLTEAWPK